MASPKRWDWLKGLLDFCFVRGKRPLLIDLRGINHLLQFICFALDFGEVFLVRLNVWFNILNTVEQ